MVIADMSSQPLGQQGYNNFIESKAKAHYFLQIDPNQTRLYDSNAKSVEEWKSKLECYYYDIVFKSMSFRSKYRSASFRARIKELNVKLYTCGLETLTENDRFCRIGI